jgi:hypothetical protein
VVVDHRRLDVGVTEVLLDLSDVHAIEQQMCREAMSKGVDGNRLVDLRLHGCGIDGLLDDGFGDVMASHHTGAWVGGERVAREHPEPSQVTARVRVLAVEGVRHPHPRESRLAVGLVQRFGLTQLGAQLVAADLGQQRGTVLVTLSAAQEHQALVEVDILHPELTTLRHA